MVSIIGFKVVASKVPITPTEYQIEGKRLFRISDFGHYICSSVWNNELKEDTENFYLYKYVSSGNSGCSSDLFIWKNFKTYTVKEAYHEDILTLKSINESEISLVIPKIDVQKENIVEVEVYEDFIFKYGDELGSDMPEKQYLENNIDANEFMDEFLSQRYFIDYSDRVSDYSKENYLYTIAFITDDNKRIEYQVYDVYGLYDVLNDIYYGYYMNVSVY